MARITVEAAGSTQVLAFLDMIAVSEIGPEMLAESDDGYNVIVGSRPGHLITFDSYADHPDIHVPEVNSDAAGRYQIMHHWWPAYKKMLNLPDFGPESQDLYAVQQLRESKAIPLLEEGNIQGSIHACSHIWASLPGAGYGQHENKLADLVDAFQKAGGKVAA